jgi:hypothetical protein
VKRAGAVVLILVAGALAGPAPAPLAAEVEPPIKILNPETVTVSPEPGAETVDVKFSVLNMSDRKIRPAPSFQASSDERVNVKKNLTRPRLLLPEKARIVTVTLTGVKDLEEAVTGEIVFGPLKEPVAQAVKVNPAPPDSPWVLGVIIASLLIAAATAGTVVLKLGDKRPRLDHAAPNPKWSFSSWGTTLTAAGAAFGVVLGAVTFPEFAKHVGKTELVNVNILFGVLVLVGPFLFEALRAYVPGRDMTKPERTGTNRTMLFASSFTLWAVTGQMGAFALLVWELLEGGTLTGLLILLVALVFIGLACWYFFSTMSEQTGRDWELEEAEQKAKEEMDRKHCCRAPEEAQAWHLL